MVSAPDPQEEPKWGSESVNSKFGVPIIVCLWVPL